MSECLPGGSDCKETACNARDQGSIAESERFPGEGNSSPLYSLVAQSIKCLPAMQETQVRSLGWKDPLEKEMATHSSILAWRIPWTEETGGLQSTGSQRVGHDWATWLTQQYSCLEKSHGQRSLEGYSPQSRGHDWATNKHFFVAKPWQQQLLTKRYPLNLR